MCGITWDFKVKSSSLTEHEHSLASTKLYCLVTIRYDIVYLTCLTYRYCAYTVSEEDGGPSLTQVALESENVLAQYNVSR